MSKTKIKVALLTEIISPYRIPVFNEMAKDERIDLLVIFLAETIQERKWHVRKEDVAFPYWISPGFSIPVPRSFPLFFNPGLYSKLCQVKPDVVICGGYHHPSFLLALLYVKRFGTKMILWSESHALSVRMRQPLATFYRQEFVKRSSSFIVPGVLAFEFLKQLGADGRQIYVAPNAVDSDFFAQRASVFRAQKDEWKKARGFPKHLILYLGRFIRSKGVPLLIEAFEPLANREDVGLLLVGDGREGKRYREWCQKQGLRRIFFEGFKQQHELPFYYALADMLVLPSLKDEWGLVLNEAMASGLPVIASDTVGAARDLIVDGVNGFVFRSGNSHALNGRIEQLLVDEGLRVKMGERSYERIQNFGPKQCAEGFLRAICDTSSNEGLR